MRSQIFVLFLMICLASCARKFYKFQIDPDSELIPYTVKLQNHPNQVDDNQEGISIGSRFNAGVGRGDASTGESEMCKSRKAFMSTPSGLGSDGETGIIAEYCENPGGSCVLSLAGLTTTCEQKYVTKVLSSALRVQEEFRVPAGCVCKFKRA